MLGGPADLQNACRPAHRVTLKDEVVLMDGRRVALKMTVQSITIGCTEITPEAARFIVREWEQLFGPRLLDEVTLQ